jgi:dTDP-4-amino-4,6-dideoxygalactose transaminase
MLTTNDGALDARFRQMRHHGMTVSDSVRHASPSIVFEDYAVLGYNYRMTDIQAAIGREQLKRLPGMIAHRRELAARYAERLASVPGVVAPAEPEWARSNWQSYAVRLEDSTAVGADLQVRPTNQRTVMQRMLDDGVSTRRGVMNSHREPAYPPGSWRTTAAGLHRSERAQDTAIILPLYHQMTFEDQDRVVDALRRAVSPDIHTT